MPAVLQCMITNTVDHLSVTRPVGSSTHGGETGNGTGNYS